MPITSFGGEVKIKPVAPKVNDNVQLTYYLDAGESRTDSITAMFFVFTAINSYPTAYETQLFYDSNSGFYNGNFSLPDEALYCILKIRIGAKYDDNYGNYWEFFVTGKDGSFQKYSKFRAALSLMGNLPENCKRNVNFNKALDYLEEENKKFPGNIQVEIGLVSLKFDLKRISENEFLQELQDLVDKTEKLDNESETLAFSRALKALNQTDRAEKIEYRVINQYPTGRLAEEFAMSELSKARSLREFSEGVEEYLAKFPTTENREKLFSALVSGYLQISKLQELNNQLNKMKGVPSIAYSQIANAVLQNPEVAPKASNEQRIELALTAVELAIEQEKKYPLSFKPIFMTLSQWKEERRIILGNLLEQKSWILSQSDKQEQSLSTLFESLDLCADYAPSSLYESLIKILKELNNDSLAYYYANTAVASSRSSEDIESILKSLFVKQGGNEDDFILHLDSLKELAREYRLKDLKYDVVRIPKIDGIVRNLDGRILNTKELAGKIVVIGFWSTWCGPCQSYLPAFKYLKNAYIDNEEVVFIPLVVWEKDEDKRKAIKEFTEEYNAEIDIYLDEYDVLPKMAGITGLPVTVFIGKNGDVQFINEGFAGDNIFLQNAKDMIDYLLR